MITIDVSDPTLYGDIEWISVKIHGQSFMLHQIVRPSHNCSLRRDKLIDSEK